MVDLFLLYCDSSISVLNISNRFVLSIHRSPHKTSHQSGTSLGLPQSFEGFAQYCIMIGIKNYMMVKFQPGLKGAHN